MSTAALWRTLRTSWWWLLAGAVAGVLVAGLLLLVLPKTYVAQSTLLVSATAADPASGQGTDTIEYATSRLPNYVAMASADATIAAIAEETGAEASDVESRLSYGVEPETTVISISAEGDTPQEAQRTAQAAAGSLTEQIVSTSTPAMTMGATVLDAAPPGVLDSPKRSVTLASGAMAGLLLGLLIALARGIRHSTENERR